MTFPWLLDPGSALQASTCVLTHQARCAPATRACTVGAADQSGPRRPADFPGAQWAQVSLFPGGLALPQLACPQRLGSLELCRLIGAHQLVILNVPLGSLCGPYSVTGHRPMQSQRHPPRRPVTSETRDACVFTIVIIFEYTVQ